MACLSRSRMRCDLPFFITSPRLLSCFHDEQIATQNCQKTISLTYDVSPKSQVENNNLISLEFYTASTLRSPFIFILSCLRWCYAYTVPTFISQQTPIFSPFNKILFCISCEKWLRVFVSPVQKCVLDTCMIHTNTPYKQYHISQRGRLIYFTFDPTKNYFRW